MPKHKDVLEGVLIVLEVAIVAKEEVDFLGDNDGRPEAKPAVEDPDHRRDARVGLVGNRLVDDRL
jgi:hypothetical protein